MTQEYEDLLRKGEEYQDYLTANLIKYGIIIMSYSSRKFQRAEGESYTRQEIKFDDKMAKTGNLYIEIAERSSIYNDFLESGVKRKDNTLNFIIGNYDIVYIFQKKILKRITDAYKSQGFRKVQTPTSIGILVPTSFAEQYAIVVDLKNNKVW